MANLKGNKLVIYLISIIVLFAIPIYTIIANTNTLKDGYTYYFKIEAYDPYDAFRGNYLDINFKEDYVETVFDNLDLKYNDKCYVKIGIHTAGEDAGFAYFSDISRERPTDTDMYYETTVNSRYYDDRYYIDTPTRYYMNETKSLTAEKFLDDNIDNAYVKVRVKDGKMVLVGVYADNILIDTID